MIAALEASLDVAEVPAVEVEDVLVQLLRSGGHLVGEAPQEREEVDRVRHGTGHVPGKRVMMIYQWLRVRDIRKSTTAGAVRT